MPPVNILIKPASSSCNLLCKYCFYHSLAEHREIPSYGVMDLITLEVLIEKALVYADHSCTFAFQGGEPTLAGLEFFEQVVALQGKYNSKKIRISNALQTNGMLITEEWAKFLAKHNFLVGLSLDGPKEIHDCYRVDASDKGTHSRVMRAVHSFNKYAVDYNILCVITANVAKHTGKIYNYFKKSRFQYLQFIPCLDSLGEPHGGNHYSLTPERYAYFLKTLFDHWYMDLMQGAGISIRYFDNLVDLAIGVPPEACGMSGRCSCQFVVEADGSVYPCDFYVVDQWRLGNVRDGGFGELKTKAMKFIEDSRHVDPACKLCEWKHLCRGGCRRDREPFEKNMLSLNYYCAAYKDFFQYAGIRISELARMVTRRINVKKDNAKRFC